MAQRAEVLNENAGASKDAEMGDSNAREAPKSAFVGMENRHWSAFLFGPFFKTIPPMSVAARKQSKKSKALDILRMKRSEDEAKAGSGADYIGALKRIVLDEVDTDGTYGLVNDELVPLPFDCPKLWEYILDFLAGTYLVAQATVVMFIAILVDNDQRGFVLGNSYSSKWMPIIKALVILYPLVTLICMCMMTCEYLFRKYMYYRMLSMRVLIDWENKALWQGFFFYYFIATWILLNVWCIYGVYQFWDTGLTSGADTIQFTTFVVVNLQTLQLLLYYYRLITSEMRLVSLNQIFERAPVEAQMLLTYTYIVEEQVLIDECRAFGHMTVDALAERLGNVFSCGKLCKDWQQTSNGAKFNLDRIKARADNYEEIEEAVQKLREDLLEEAAETEGEAAASDIKLLSASSKSKSKRMEAHYPAINAQGGGPLSAPAPLASPTDAALTDLNEGAGGKAGAGTKEEPASTLHGIEWLEEKSSDLSFFRRWERSFQRALYYRFYGSIHGLYCAFLIHFPTWPYRGDVAYLRSLCVVEIIGIFSVGAIVVFGVLRATSTSKCNQGDRQCNACADFLADYSTTCPINYNITSLLTGEAAQG